MVESTRVVTAVVPTPLSIADYDEMIDFWSRSPGVGLSSADGRDAIERFLSRNEGMSFGVRHEGRLIGTILAGHDGRRGYLYHVAVDDRHRRCGIASVLVSAALEALEAAGIEKSHLFVFRTNRRARRFWRAVGWARRRDIVVFSREA